MAYEVVLLPDSYHTLSAVAARLDGVNGNAPQQDLLTALREYRMENNDELNDAIRETDSANVSGCYR